MNRIAAKFKISASRKFSTKSDRPRKTSPRYDRVITRISLQNRFKSATEISRQLSLTSHVKVSCQTASQRLRDSGLLA